MGGRSRQVGSSRSLLATLGVESNLGNMRLLSQNNEAKQTKTPQTEREGECLEIGLEVWEMHQMHG